MNSQTTDKRGWSYSFVRYFLQNRQLTILLLLLIVLIGSASFLQLRVEGFPAVKIPIAIVTTVVPGAGPETINNTVTVPIENALRDLDGLKEISSTSQNNVSVIVLNFEDGIDSSTAIQDARTKIGSANLPEGVGEPNIIVPETGGAPFFVAVSGGANLLSLREQAQTIEEKILAVNGVKTFTDISGVKEKIYIDVKPELVNPQIIEQIANANIGFPLGETVINGKVTPVSGASAITT
ncbi:MAG: efflux RND transporter permease subunit, partial [bacterium]|nr:efflux RND transporter permease subunit [bacterium]